MRTKYQSLFFVPNVLYNLLVHVVFTELRKTDQISKSQSAEPASI